MTEFDSYRHYLEREKGRSVRTATEYINDVRGFRKHLDSSTTGLPPSWAEVMPKHIRAYLTSLGDVSEHRTHRIVSSLRNWFEFLWKVQRDITGNPALEISKPKLPKRLPVYLQSHEVSRVIDAALKGSRRGQVDRNWALIAFMYGTGLRISEVLGLRLDCVQYQDGVPSSVRVIGKGDKEREVPLSSTAQRALHQWLKHRRLEGSPREPHVWVYTSGRSKGKPLQTRAVHKMLTRFTLEAGLGKISAHKLRSSFASALADTGRSLDEIKELLGHSSIATTQIYVRTSRARLAAAAASLPDVLDVGR